MLSAFRNFLISFIIATVVFGLLAFTGAKVAERLFLSDNDDDSEETDNGNGNNEQHQDDDTGSNTKKLGVSFSFVLIGSDYQGDKLPDYSLDPEIGVLYNPRIPHADTVIFARFCAEKNEVIVCPIPSTTKVDVKGVSMTIGEAYYYEGASYVAGKVATLTGMSVDYYAATTMDGLAKIIDSIGGIDFTVPQAMNYSDPEQGLTIKLAAGKQLLSGEDAVKMLRYNGYNDNTSRTELACEFGSALISRLTTYTNMLHYADLFGKLSANVETNYTVSALGSNLNLIFSYRYLNTVYLTYPGTYTEGGFTPDTINGHKLMASYK